MFGQIMVPLDGSLHAERALPCAEHLARLSNATVHLVHSMEPPLDPATMIWVPDMVSVPSGLYGELLGSDSRQATLYLDRVYAQVTAAGLRARAVTLTGHAAALLDYERAAGIDLVVMTSHGRGGLARLAFGSVAARLVRRGTVPVLLVRAFGDPVSLARAVVPLDGSARAEEALPIVEALAHDVLREVTLLRVVDSAEHGLAAYRYLAAVADRLHRLPLACYRRVMRGDPAAAISTSAGPTELIVMATHGRSGLARWALGSVADRVVHGGGAGVLLVRAGGATRLGHLDQDRLGHLDQDRLGHLDQDRLGHLDQDRLGHPDQERQRVGSGGVLS